MARLLQISARMGLGIVDLRAHRGPNRFALFPVVTGVFACGDARDRRACERLAAWAIALQRAVGHDVRHREVRDDPSAGGRRIVVECRDPDTGRDALEHARILVQRVLYDGSEDPRHCVQAFVDRAAARRLGPSTRSVVEAAERRGIPWARLDEGMLVRLGTGKRQRLLRATVTGVTSAVAADVAGDKRLCARLLRQAGLPVPEQREVGSAAEAAEAAEAVGWPVVVKPLDGNHGRGVSIGMQDDVAVRAAFDEARLVRDRVLVESFVDGDDHRLLVVGGELVAAARRVPGHVTGDGVLTVRQLVDGVNSDPRRGTGHEDVLTRLEIDPEATRLMREAGVDLDTVLPEGRRLSLRRTANMSKGGTAEDVTDVVHPDNRWLAERAAKIVGLDVAGIDFLTSDITRSYREVGGAICEVNAGPGLRMHLAPTVGRPRDVGGAIVDALFPPGTPATIPTAAITGTNGKTTTARLVAHIHRQAGLQVGLSTSEGVYVDGRLTVPGDMTGPLATETVLADPTIDIAVLELARGGILRAGLAIDSCDVGAVLNVQSDHLGTDGVQALEEMAEVKSVVARIAREAVVLNADDPACVRMAQRCERARRLVWVTSARANPLVLLHVRRGGTAVVLEQAPKGMTLTLHHDGGHFPIARTDDVPVTLGGLAEHNVVNAMFAAAIAFCGGASVEAIREGLCTFEPSFELAPGRANLYRGHDFDVLLDYGHNVPGFEAIGQLARRMPVSGRRSCVVGLPGNRQDADFARCAAALAPFFDHFVCREEDNRRGRAPGEIPRLLRDGLLEAGVSPDRITVVDDEAAGVEAGLRMARPGDLMVAFAADLERTWRQIQRVRPARPEARLALGGRSA